MSIDEDLHQTRTRLNRNVQPSAALVIPTGFSAPVTEILDEVIQRIVEALRPEKIVLFGSYAYGEPTPDSDVDFLSLCKRQLQQKSDIWRYHVCYIHGPFRWTYWSKRRRRSSGR